MNPKDIVQTKWYSTPAYAIGEVVEISEYTVQVYLFDHQQVLWYDKSQLNLVPRYQDA